MNLTETPKVGRGRLPGQEPIPPSRQPVHPVLWLLVGGIILIHLLQQLAAIGVAPVIFDWRVLFTLFAFFDSEFDAALAGMGVSPQLVWSTVTHAFLHANWLHLGLNMAVFIALGHAIVQGIGIGRFLVAFVVCAALGAIALGLISDVQGPLVGASGAVFGFLAMITAWQEQMLRRQGRSRRAIWWRIIGLVIINALLALGLGGLLAWEAHLGGFVAGWLLAAVWRPKAIRLPF